MRILTVEQRKTVLHGYYKVNDDWAQRTLLLYVTRSLMRKEAWRGNT